MNGIAVLRNNLRPLGFVTKSFGAKWLQHNWSNFLNFIGFLPNASHQARFLLKSRGKLRKYMILVIYPTTINYNPQLRLWKVSRYLLMKWSTIWSIIVFTWNTFFHHYGNIKKTRSISIFGGKKLVQIRTFYWTNHVYVPNINIQYGGQRTSNRTNKIMEIDKVQANIKWNFP